MKTKLIIFGITGDLSHRKLLPALTNIVKEGGEDLSIIGVSRRDVAVSELLEKHDSLVARTSVFTMDLADAEGYIGLKEHVALQEDEQALVYLSVPPSAAADIVDFLGEAGFNTPNVKILFEKPFGFDLASAQDFLERTGRYFDESQLYRIDHYMAKEVAQEILRLRHDASTHHHTWSREDVASIDIIASEKIGVEGRGIFYEQTGALRDFIQGHLLQLLTLTLMEMGDAPLALRRLAVLQALQPAHPDRAVRAQYQGYDEEVENPGSRTETFAALEFESNDARWAGVRFRLITGKALNEKKSSLRIVYRDGSEEEFDEAVFSSNEKAKDAYERVLLEALAGRKELFTSGPEVIRAWELVADVQESWAMENEALRTYSQGTSVEEILA